MLLRGWREVFGSRDDILRLPSLLCSLGVIALLFAVMRRLSGTMLATGVCVLAAVAHPQIQYAQEARNYMLALCLAMCACWLMLSIEDKGATPFRLLGLGLTALAAPLTHYFALGPLAALALYCLLRMRCGQRRIVLGVFAIAAIVFTACWGPTLWLQLRQAHTNSGFLFEDTGCGQTALNALRIPLRQLVKAGRQLLGQPIPLPELLIDRSLAVAVFVAVVLLPLRALRSDRGVLLWWLWLVVAIGELVCLDTINKTDSASLTRYSLFCAPAVFALLGLAVASTRRMMRVPLRLLPLAAVIALCLFLRPLAYQPGIDWSTKPDFRGVAEYIRQNASPSDVVVVFDQHDPGELALETHYYMMDIELPTLMLNEPASDAERQRLRQAHCVWYVATRSNPVARLEDIIGPAFHVVSGGSLNPEQIVFFVQARADMD
jgi:uncharacterized membrane protein